MRTFTSVTFSRTIWERKWTTNIRIAAWVTDPHAEHRLWKMSCSDIAWCNIGTNAYPAKTIHGVVVRLTDARSSWSQLYCRAERGEFVEKFLNTLKNEVGACKFKICIKRRDCHVRASIVIVTRLVAPSTCSLPRVQLCSVDMTVKCIGPEEYEYQGLSAADVGIGK